MMPCAFQACSIVLYSVILFCRFLAAARLSGLTFSRPMTTRVTPARFAFSMDLVAQCINLDHEAERDSVSLAQRDQAVEDRFPFLVPGKIVVGDEEFVDALRPVEPYQMLDVVGRAEARLAPLHVDDGAERALIGAAA